MDSGLSDRCSQGSHNKENMIRHVLKQIHEMYIASNKTPAYLPRYTAENT